MTRQNLLITGAGGLLTAGLLATATLAMPAAASAAPAPSAFQSATALSDADQTVLKDLYRAALAHKAVEDLVTEKADANTLPDLLAHSQHFSATSAALKVDLESLAFNEGVTLQTSLEADDRTRLDKAAKASGKKFGQLVVGLQQNIVFRESVGARKAAKSSNAEMSAYGKKASPEYARFFDDLGPLADELGVKRATINTGTGEPQPELPAGVGIVLVLAGAGIAGGSLLTARRATR